LRSSASNRQLGAIRLEIVVVVVVLLVLAGFLLRGLLVLQQEVERTLVDAEVMTLRTELQMEVASAINRGEEGRLQKWVGKNPLELAGRAPDAQGLPRSVGGARLGGEWRWDAAKGALNYDYSDGHHLQLRILRSSGGAAAGWGLGGNLILVHEQN
jgi:type II secretory pathway pseudopilin PulG